MIATVALPFVYVLAAAVPATSYNPDIYHLGTTITVMDLTGARASSRGYQMRTDGVYG
jgi:hypothetical protein